MRSWAIGFVTLVFATPAYAQETSSPASADVLSGAPGSSTPRFAAPNGQLGAGLSLSPEQRGRGFVEVGFGRVSDSQSQGGVTSEAHIDGLSFIVGGGFKVLPNLELEAMLPLAWADFGASLSAPGLGSQSQSDSALAIGNLHLGAGYLYGKGQLRVKVGGAVEYGPWSGDHADMAVLALGLGYVTRAAQDVGLWRPEALTVMAPARIEYGDRLVLGGDAALGTIIPTNGSDVEIIAQIDPSVGFYALETVLVGLRVPFVFVPTQSGSSATYLAAEPYARFDVGPGFIATRFTLNIDQPLGFSFDDGKFWGAHVGGGGSF